MHNGDVGDFRLVRRKLLASVCDEAFGNVYGSTDSEHFFALFIDSLLGTTSTIQGCAWRKRSRARSAARSSSCEGRRGSDSYLNLAISDGEHAVVSRFTDAADGVPESLYYFTGRSIPTSARGAKTQGARTP